MPLHFTEVVITTKPGLKVSDHMKNQLSETVVYPQAANIVDKTAKDIEDLIGFVRTIRAELEHSNPDHMFRISTNEFFFYKKEPFTLDEFEAIQNRIVNMAHEYPKNLQLLLGSFAVQDGNFTLNVTPHITCGDPVDVQFIVKSFADEDDPKYSLPSGETMKIKNVLHPPIFPDLPSIMVNQVRCPLTFNNVVPCRTLNNTPFLTVVDVCLDHDEGVGMGHILANKKNHNPSLPISHVVISNSINLNPRYSMGEVVHVDPSFSNLNHPNEMQITFSTPMGEMNLIQFQASPIQQTVGEVQANYRDKLSIVVSADFGFKVGNEAPIWPDSTPVGKPPTNSKPAHNSHNNVPQVFGHATATSTNDDSVPFVFGNATTTSSAVSRRKPGYYPPPNDDNVPFVFGNATITSSAFARRKPGYYPPPNDDNVPFVFGEESNRNRAVLSPAIANHQPTSSAIAKNVQKMVESLGTEANTQTTAESGKNNAPNPDKSNAPKQ